MNLVAGTISKRSETVLFFSPEKSAGVGNDKVRARPKSLGDLFFAKSGNPKTVSWTYFIIFCYS